MKLGRLQRMQIRPNNSEKTEFLFLLKFLGEHQSVEFETSGEGAMLILDGLRRLQAQYKIPIPPKARPSGKPVLHVVTDAD